MKRGGRESRVHKISEALFHLEYLSLMQSFLINDADFIKFMI